jgi:hypothetical protein
VLGVHTASCPDCNDGGDWTRTGVAVFQLVGLVVAACILMAICTLGVSVAAVVRWGRDA